jgi:minor histocompatibility antigen H13
MATTMFVMIKFNAAQPALLYLVPACLGSSFLTAIVRGEVKALLAYSEEVVVEEEKEKEEMKPVDEKKKD